MMDLWREFATGALCLAVGVAIGSIWGSRWLRKTRSSAAPHMDDSDSQRLLDLLSELEHLTQRSTDDLVRHQELLDSLSQLVGQTRPATPRDAKLQLLMQNMLQSNHSLQRKLQAAEQLLEEKSRQIKDYLTEARTDPLTGLANRRAFDGLLEQLFAAHRRGGRCFTVALIDLDHFKSINDAHGHDRGDRTLLEVAALLRDQLDDALQVARIGGEEFAVVMDLPLRQSADRMDLFRQQVASRFRQTGGDGALTCSAGIAEPGDDLGVASVVRRADEALYAAKNAGRNRTYFHDGREPTLVGSVHVVG